MANLNLNGNISKNEEILQLAYKDLITFGKLFSPQDFLATSTPPFHNRMSDIMLDRTKQQVAMILPRDHAKSTMAANAILHRFLFATKDKPEFICWVGEAQDQAIDNLQWVSSHIYENPAVHYYFGDLTGSKWTKTDIWLKNDSRMIAKGTSQRIRGKKQLSTRYTLIVLDDFESEGNTKTPESRQAIRNWVTAAVYPAIDFDKGGSLWCNGTIVHYDSFLNNILTEYNKTRRDGTEYSWKIFSKKAIEDGKPIWKSRWSLPKLEARKQFYIDSGTPSKFYQEYMNQARAPEDVIFTEEDINKSLYDGTCKFDTSSDCWYIDMEDGSKVYLTLFMGVDPASSLSTRADFSVIMITGVSSNNEYYIVDYWRERALPMDCAEQIFTMYDQYKEKFRRINIETITYQEMLRDYVMRRGKEEGKYLPGIHMGIKNYANQKKKDRLFEGLQPLFKAGAVHIKRSQTDLISELMDFPKGSHDDTIDAFWLSTQFTRNIKPRIKKAEEDSRKRPVKRQYNFMSGARV